MYDIIGDIHGHASRLEQLLERMGYERDADGWQHPDRQAIFVGDFIDRGPEQIETYRLVRSMIDRGTALAVMGNHEFNAVAFKTPHPEQPGKRLRPHTEKNRNQHAAFLEQVGEHSALHEEMVAWFKTLPLYLDLEGLRVVHACWHDASLKTLTPMLDHRQCLHGDAWSDAARKGTDAYNAAETLLKGFEIPLPPGESFLDKQGNERRHIRTRWWEQHGGTVRSIALMDDATREALSQEPVPGDVLPGYTDEKPVFVGHYWLRGTPAPVSDRVACLDYTVTDPAPVGKLTSYRWDGEQNLNSDRFLWV
ncbi:metallophosphoesterase [Spiribacter sp. SSL99]|uniref:metallophosphoesterase n=1 Tax=Spiribacter sp. SSL99 TaxID=1866884 RepID=UPI0013306B07|nr:metallophosphoesterase [Spiribacter sp. SSL99]KAF0285812.1 metallophosphoesterase [Spiribacter sp. SSL99]